MTPEEFLAVVKSEPVDLVSAAGVYHLGRASTTKTLASSQSRLLAACRSLPGSTYLVSWENPADWEHGNWQSVNDDQWTVPASMDTDVMLRGILESGAWRMYVASAPVETAKLPVLFRSPPDDVATVLRSLHIAALIDAWYDSTEWRIGISNAVESEGNLSS